LAIFGPLSSLTGSVWTEKSKFTNLVSNVFIRSPRHHLYQISAF
jgi:hypothetical protein